MGKDRWRGIPWRTLAVTICLAAGCGDGGSGKGGVQGEQASQPVYIFPFDHTEDHVNVGLGSEAGLSETRFLRMVPFLDGLKRDHPEASFQGGPIATFQFYGADSEAFEGREDATGVVSVVRGAEAGGAIEVGYHGAHEPTEQTSPMLGFRVENAGDVPEYLDRLALFLTSWRDPYRGFEGDSDPERPGALLKTAQVFFRADGSNRMNTLTGAPWTPLSIPYIRRFAPVFVTFGFEDHGPCQTQPSGVCSKTDEEAAEIQAMMDRLSPTPRSAPEIYWADNLLRTATDGGANGGIGSMKAVDGRESVAADLSTLDRTRPHVVRLFFAHHNLYSKRSPSGWAYDHPDDPRLPAQFIQTEAEIEANYRTTEETFRFLVEEYLPRESAGGALVGGRGLIDLFEPACCFDVDSDELAAATGDLLDRWTGAPPLFVQGADHTYFTLAEMFYLLAASLGTYRSDGTLPSAIHLPEVFGPVLDAQSPNTPAILASADVVDAAGPIAGVIAEQGVTPEGVPRNAVPVDILLEGGERVDPLAFLRAMAEVRRDIARGSPRDSVAVSTSAFNQKDQRLLVSLWAVKPAVLRETH